MLDVIIFAGDGLALLLCLGCVIAGTLSNLAPISQRKGKLRFSSLVSLGLSCLVFALFAALHRHLTPRLRVSGPIVNATIRKHGRLYETDVVVAIDNMTSASLVASGRNIHFHPGERVEATYWSGTGRIKDCSFYSESGTQEGRFSDAGSLQLICVSLLGLFVIYCARRNHRLDPEGEQESARYKNSLLNTTTDAQSLLGINQLKR